MCLVSKRGVNCYTGGHKDPLEMRLGEVAKNEENSFYGKMIEDLDHHKIRKHSREGWVVQKDLRFQFFSDLQEIDSPYEIKKIKQIAFIKRPYQHSNLVYQLADLQMLDRVLF